MLMGVKRKRSYSPQRISIFNLTERREELEQPERREYKKYRRQSGRDDEKDVPPRVVQSVLDLGQKDWQIHCIKCGMFYSPGNEEDEAMHAQFHKKSLAPILYSGGKNQTILKEWNDGSYVVSVATDEAQFKRDKIQQIRQIVDNELNFNGCETWIPQNEKTYIYVRRKKVLGCVVAETIKKAFKVIQNAKSSEDKPESVPTSVTSQQQTLCTPSSQQDMSGCVVSHVPQPALVGLSRIWVHHQYRKQGIASSLVDVVRVNFIYGEIVKKEMIALSQPSPEGKQFATKYFGTPQFLVYTFT